MQNFFQRPHLHRNARAADSLELFFVASVASVLLTRFYLYLTDYPQLGGRTLHIAHMLPGGLLMMTALILLFTVLGYRVHRLAALLGGIGFGLFIDELGKFITQDNNYFFQPTIALIYLFFVALLLTIRYLSRKRQLTQEENLLNALAILEEVVIHDLDRSEKRQALKYLHAADPNHPLVKPLINTLTDTLAQPDPPPQWWTKFQNHLMRWYQRFITAPWGLRLFVTAVVAKTSWEFFTVGLALLPWVGGGQLEAPRLVIQLEFLSALVVTFITLRAVVVFQSNRLYGYELLQRAVLIDIFLTQFFAFYRESLEALPLLVMNLIFYVTLRFLITEEKRSQLRQA